MSVRILDGAMDDFLGAATRTGEDAASTIAALEAGSMVAGLHRAFLEAGAEIVRTHTASLNRWRCNMEGLADRFAEANERACAAATAARDAVNPAALVAGRLGPVRARYEPDYLPPVAIIEQETLEQAILLARHVDLFILETLSLGAEAAAMVRAAASTGRPVWVAFTFHEKGRLLTRGGETPAQALAALEGLPVEAILVNCTSPEMVGEAIAAFASLCEGLPVGGYAHAFEAVGTPLEKHDAADEVGGRIAMTPSGYAKFAREWIARGAAIVGGCCGVGPVHVAALKKLAAEVR